MKLRIRLKPDLLLKIFLALYLLITIFTLTNYADAWDNVSMYRYAQDTARIYQQPFQQYSANEYGPLDLRYFGPFLVTFAYLVDALIGSLLTFWSTLDLFRFIYFLTYLAGVLGFYSLCKRYFSGWVALSTSLLFISQPLFFGQAPVNPKDTTFLAMVIIGIYLGLKILDHLPERTELVIPSRRVRPVLITSGAFLLILIIRKPAIRAVFGWAVGPGAATGFGQFLSRLTAELGTEPYITKAAILSLRILLVVYFLALLALLGRVFLPDLLRSFGSKYVLAAGIVLGLTVSVRILGLIILAVVGLSLLLTRRIRDWFYPLSASILTAVITVYLTWPYLWPRPVPRFVQSLAVNLGHQHNPPVFFLGKSYPAADLPSSYVPVLIAVQFTLPLILMSLCGLVMVAARLRKTRRELLILVGAWFLLPLAAFMVLRPALHDNLRHVLFITPPLFLLAGFFLEEVWGWLDQRRYLFALLAALIVLPGVVHIVRAHPYEYIYFNQLAGGTAAGVELFESDYLALSLSEGIEYLNSNAEPNSTVYVQGPYRVARSISRADLSLVSRNDHSDDPLDQPNTYLVSFEPIYENSDLVTIYQVYAGGVPLGGVYRHLGSE